MTAAGPYGCPAAAFGARRRAFWHSPGGFGGFGPPMLALGAPEAGEWSGEWGDSGPSDVNAG